MKSLSRVWLFATPWTVASQAPLSVGFSRQEYWSGLPFPSPRELPDPRIKPTSPAYPELSGSFFIIESPGKPLLIIITYQVSLYWEHSYILLIRKVIIFFLACLLPVYFVHQSLHSMKAGTMDGLGHHFITAHSIGLIPTKWLSGSVNRLISCLCHNFYHNLDIWKLSDWV